MEERNPPAITSWSKSVADGWVIPTKTPPMPP